MYNEDDLLPISALQHYLYCPRQCALIHLEQAWSENKLTAQGRQLHDRAHDGSPESRGDQRIVRGLRLCSPAMGLTGQADVVELQRAAPDSPPDQVTELPGLEGRWTLYPVEYKRGRPKSIDCDRVQLCAQAMCLEEMLNVRIQQGSLYYGQPRRREHVIFDHRLRDLTRQTALEVHALLGSGLTPPARKNSGCKKCSLIDSCMPGRTSGSMAASRYLQRQLHQAIESPLDGDTDENA